MDPVRFDASAWGTTRKTFGPHGYYAFFPERLPRELPLEADVVWLLSNADLALGRLAGAGRLLPEPQILIAPYVRLEALASSRIEGTQASLADIFEATATGAARSVDIQEVMNYVAALDHGLELLRGTLPLSLRLVREMHRVLLTGVRGHERTPGEFRTSQNWIGSPDGTIEHAVFVPPPPDAMVEALKDWEAFHHEDAQLPLLVQCALLHYQFETIHPFLDGNGRLGRLMIVLYLIERGPLPAPLLYLSSYFEHHRSQYYDTLQGVREQGGIQRWLRFFLTAVATQAEDAVERTERLNDLREQYRRSLATSRSSAPRAIDLLFRNPVLTTAYVSRELGMTTQGARNILRELESRGLLRRVQGHGRGGRWHWIADEVHEVLFRGTERQG